jgi:DNA-binding CsgD family transcriptional regulator
MTIRTAETLETRENADALPQWATLLHHLQNENAALKTQLAEAIRLCVTSEQLDTLESFQARFIAKDTIIALLRRDLAKFAIANRAEANPTSEQRGTSSKLGRDILRMKEQFLHLRKEFEDYLATLLLTAGRTA